MKWFSEALKVNTSLTHIDLSLKYYTVRLPYNNDMQNTFFYTTSLQMKDVKTLEKR